jgi:ribonuclease HI
VGLGVVVRDSEGLVAAAMLSSGLFPQDSDTAAALAVWRAIGFCKEMGFSRMIFEGDALVVIKALNSDAVCWSRYGHVMDDSRILLKDFSQVSVQHVGRSANRAALLLAKYALSSPSDLFWVEDNPPPIRFVILAEQGSIA